MKYKKNFIFIAFILILLTVFSEAYKKTIITAYGQQVPEIWTSDFADMTFGEIYQEIGQPQEDVSAKEYQNWLIRYWWGWKMLKMISNNCCPLTSKPTDIYYIVHVNGWYKPVYFKKIR